MNKPHITNEMRPLPRFDVLMDNLPAPVLLMMPDWSLRYANNAAETVIGRSRAALQGQDIREVFEENSALFEVIERAFFIGPLSVYDITVGARKQPMRQSDVHIYPRGDDILIMIYPRGAAELLDKTADASAAAQSLTGMAAHLAHEIRNPLGGIRGAAQLLMEDVPDEALPLIDIINEESARINRIVSDFEAQASGAPPDISAVNIHDVIDKVLRAARAGYARHVHIHESYDPSLPEIAVDRERFVQVLHNLIKNAAEATGKRDKKEQGSAQIWINTKYRSGVKRRITGAKTASNLPVQIQIIDNGVGIQTSMLADIFNPFVTTKTEGTGLGLAVVSRMINEVGGTIEVSSRKGHTEFRLLLPVFKLGQN